jgi:hypothetical protein
MMMGDGDLGPLWINNRAPPCGGLLSSACTDAYVHCGMDVQHV